MSALSYAVLCVHLSAIECTFLLFQSTKRGNPHMEVILVCQPIEKRKQETEIEIRREVVCVVQLT